MALRYYSNTAVATTLAAPIAGGDTSLVVTAASGFPGSFPYTLIVDYGASTSEVVEVTAAAGTTLTVTRGVDNTSAQAHGLAAVVVHGISKRDVSEPNTHIAASADIHGLSGGAAVTGTTQAQTLTNKTMSGASNTFTSLPAAQVTGALSGVSSVTSSGAIAGTTLTGSSTVTGTALIPTGLTGATTASRYVGGTATVAPATGTFSVGDFVITVTGKIFVCTTGGSPGTWTNVGSLYLPLAGGTLSGGLTGTTGSFSGAFDALSAAITNAVTARNVAITGTTDTVQLSVKGNGTQTSFIAEYKKSDNTSLVSIDNSGNIIVAGTSTLTGNVIGGTTNAIEVSNSAVFNIGTALTSLTWDTNAVGDATMHSTVSNTSRLVAPRTGRYQVDCWIGTGAQSAGNFEIRFRKDGATDFGADRRAANTGSNNYISLSYSTVLAAAGYAEVRAFSSGAAINTIAAETKATMRYIGPV